MKVLIRDLTLIANAHENIDVDNTAGGVGLTPPSTAAFAYITAETAQMRFTVDGSAPTTTSGHILEAGDCLWLTEHEEVRLFKAIRTGATSGDLQVSYFQ